MSGMSEYLTGRRDGMKGAHPRENKRREPHATREDTTATKHTNHKPEGTKRASGMPTRKHARAGYGKGARARTHRREHHGDRRTQDRQRERRKQRCHASAPADRKTAKKPTLLPLSVAHKHRRKHNTTNHTSATATNKHHGMNTNANTGMLCATRRRTGQ